MEPIYSVDEVAKKLCKSTRTIRTWIAQGKLSARRVGGIYIVTQDAMDEMVKPVDRKQLARDFIEFMQTLNIPRGATRRIEQQDLQTENNERRAE